MLQPNTIKAAKGARRTFKRVGRGSASGKGTTGGRGGKGQTARSGGSKGLQLKGFRAQLLSTPKLRGFKSGIVKPAAVTLYELDKHFADGDTVTLAALIEKNLVNNTAKSAKIVATGALSKKLTLEGIKTSKGALERITAIGGQVK